MSSSHVTIMSDKSSTMSKSRRKSKHTGISADFEQSDLYKSINEAVEESWIKSLNSIVTMSATTLRQKSFKTGNTYLHELILALSRLHANNDGDVRIAVILIYRLVLYGCDVNAQNDLGNTCLHLACFRPVGDQLAAHLLRLGW